MVSSVVQHLSNSGYYLDGDPTQWSSFATNNPGLYKATMIASGGLSGGISSSIAGGNFWKGVQQGVITSGLNHLAHLRYDSSRINKVLRQADVNGSDKPDISYDSISRLNDTPTLNEDYVRAGKPTGDLLTIHPNNPNFDYGEIDMSYANSKGAIKVYHRAFNSWKELAGTLVHEYRHRYHFVNGQYKKWVTKYGTETAQNISEVFAHRWQQYSGDPTGRISEFEGKVYRALNNYDFKFITNY